MKYFTITVLFTLLSSSCSWNQAKLQEEDDSSEVMKYFESKDDTLSKFEVKNDVEDKNKVRELKKEHSAKKKKAINSNDKKSALPYVEKEYESFSPLINYPENYPEELVRFDKIASAIWPQFEIRFDINERLDYNVKFFGITVGKLSFSVLPLINIDDKPAYHFQAHFVSAPFYRFVYEINDFIHSYVRTEDFSPVKYLLQQRESRQNVDDLQLFDNKNYKTYYRYRREKEGQVKLDKKDTFIPQYFQDSFSSLFFTRGLPLKPGEIYKFPVITRGKVWLVKINVIKKEKIWTELGQMDAVKVVAETEYQYPGDIKKKGKLTFWFEDGEKHHLLKFKGDIKIGSIIGEITNKQLPASK